MRQLHPIDQMVRTYERQRERNEYPIPPRPEPEPDCEPVHLTPISAQRTINYDNLNPHHAAILSDFIGAINRGRV
jgi:hypothetical protein